MRAEESARKYNRVQVSESLCGPLLSLAHLIHGVTAALTFGDDSTRTTPTAVEREAGVVGVELEKGC